MKKPASLLALMLLFFPFLLRAEANNKTTLTFKVDEAYLLWQLSGYNTSPAWQATIKAALTLKNSSGKPFLDCLETAVSGNDTVQQLSSIFNPLKRFSGSIMPSATNKQTIAVLKGEFEKEFSHTAGVLYKRMENTTVAKVVSVLKDVPNGNLIVVLDKVVDKSRVISILTTRNALDFWETYECAEIFEYLQKANTQLSKSTGIENALWQLLYPNVTENGFAEGAGVGFAKPEDTATINKMLAQASAELPADAIFLWDKNTIGKTGLTTLYVAKNKNGSNADITAMDVALATALVEENKISTRINLNTTGTAKFENLTEKAAFSSLNGAAISRDIIISIDYKVFMAPKVLAKIRTGAIVITGMQTPEEASDMASMLNGGEVPVKLLLQP